MLCEKVLELHPPDGAVKLLDVGCGEGRNSLFFATHGYDVTAFDISPAGVDKALQLAGKAGLPLDVFVGDLTEFRPQEQFDIIFSTGVLQYIPEELIPEIIGSYMEHTSIGGINAHSVLLEKPFIPSAPDGEPDSRLWRSGEVFSLYADWRVEYCCEEIFECLSGSIPHEHAVNRIIACRIR